MRNRLFGLLSPQRGSSQNRGQPPRRVPRRFDARQRLLDPEVTVEHAFESFATEDSQILGLTAEIAPVMPNTVTSPAAPARAARAASVSAPKSVPATPMSATGLDPRTIPTGVLAPDWPLLVPKTARPVSEHGTTESQRTENAATSAPERSNADCVASEVKVSSAVALLVAWLVALAIAVMAFLAEGPHLLPAVRSAIVRPAPPPPPVVQTHRTEDVHLPSPEARRPRKSR